MKNNYDAVFYDFDGTLVDTVPLIVTCFIRTYERLFGSCQRSEEDFKSYIGKPLENAFEMHSQEERDKLVETYLEINEKLLKEDKAPLFPYIKEDLLYLKSLGVIQGIVTSKRRDSVDITMKLQGLEGIFDVVISKDDCTKHKPDAQPLLTACDRCGVDPSRVIYVGDAIPDMLCAGNAGSPFAMADWTRMDRERMLSNPSTIVLKRLKELSCIIFEGEL